MQILARTLSYTLVGCVLAAAAIAVTVWPTPEAADPAADIEVQDMLAPAATNGGATDAITSHVEAPPPARSGQLMLVFRAGGATYMQLAEREVKHGKQVLADDEYVTSAIAEIDAPADLRSWLGKSVTVDGACSARVTGFAQIARLTGSPAYAGLETEKWTAATVMANGAKVIAARLDNCAGGTYARDAALSPVIVPTVITDDALAQTAQRMLFATREVRAAQTEWAAAGQTGTWYKVEGATVDTKVVRHPVTGTTWVSVHAHQGFACGLPNPNVWGLYRVGADGTLVREQAQLGELTQIEKLVDIDGDGELEVIGSPWLGTERAVQHADGAGMTSLALPLFLCPC